MITHPLPRTRPLGFRAFCARALASVLALAALAVSTRSLAQTPTFSALVTTSTGNPSYEHPNLAGVGDFNGDGKLDALISTGSANLRLMLGNGTGTFTQLYVSTPGAGNQSAVKVADLNGDGRLDAITASNQGNLAAAVLINTGNLAGVPQFTVANYTNPGFGTSGLRSLTIGDLNADGKPDFVVGNAHGGLRVWLNNGDSTFAGGQYYGLQPGAGGPSVGPGVIADFNGDGKADYLVTSNQNHAINIFFGNGDGTFQATPGIIPSTDGMWPVVSDLNHDGKPDFLVIDVNGATSGKLLVYLNNGNGTFSGPTAYATGLASWGPLAIADINGDGKIDAVVSDYNNGSGINNVAVLLGNGDATFGAGNLYNSTLRAMDLSVGDFNGDGKPDIASVGYNNNTYGVLLNTAVFAPPLPTQTLTILGGSGSVGGVAANVEYFNPITGKWQPAYLTGGHPWGFVTGTNSWINYKVNSSSDPGAGPTTNQTLWYLYRVRFTVPADAQDPKMTFSLKADNFAQVAINGVTAGGSTQYINNTSMNNVIVGQADQVNADAAFSQSVQVGENTITLNIGDWGGVNGFNFRIDLSMKSGQPVEIVPVNPDTTAPVISGPSDLTREATSAAGAVVTFSATATDNVDGSVAVVASPASGSTFPIGTTAVGLAASDAAGNTGTASFNVTVQDTTPPVISSLTASTTSLWPANHKMVAITLNAVASDAVGVTSLKIISVASNEPDNGLGDGDMAGDIQITGPLSLNLRAERSGTGNGRVYTITLEARDAAGKASTKTVSVSVPKSQGK